MKFCSKQQMETEKKEIRFRDINPGQTFRWKYNEDITRVDMKIANEKYIVLSGNNPANGLIQEGNIYLDFIVTDVDKHCICRIE